MGNRPAESDTVFAEMFGRSTRFNQDTMRVIILVLLYALSCTLDAATKPNVIVILADAVGVAHGAKSSAHWDHGAELPHAAATLDGESLLPMLTQTGPLQRPALFWHMPTYTTNYGRTPCAVIREGDWKLIHWFGDYLDTTGFAPDDKPYGKLVVGPRTELFNLREDPNETHNLAADRPNKTSHLTNALHAWFKRTKAKLPTANPDFNEKRWWQSEGKPSKGEN